VSDEDHKIAGPVVIVLALILLIGVLLGSGCGFKSIPPGSVGVKFNGASGVSTHLLRPEVVWVGWNEQLIIYPTNIQQATFVKSAQEGTSRRTTVFRRRPAKGRSYRWM